MNEPFHSFRATRLALIAFGLVCMTAPAAAQPADKEITVEAPEVVHHVVGRTAYGAPEELISIVHRVSYTDLDLTKAADVDVLKERIGHAAKAGCSQLKTLFPSDPDDPDCVEKASDSGMRQAQAAIAAATR